MLVDVGGGFETHLCEATSDSTARAALDTRQALPDSLADALERGGDDDRLDNLTPCSGDGPALRVVDTWFPKSGPLPGIGVLVSVIGEKVEAFGSAWVTGVPGEFLDELRKGIRKHLCDKGFRAQTMVVNGLLHAMSDDTLDAIDPDVRAAWIDGAVRRMGVVEPIDGEPIAARPQSGVDWRTWVLDE